MIERLRRRPQKSETPIPFSIKAVEDAMEVIESAISDVAKQMPDLDPEVAGPVLFGLRNALERKHTDIIETAQARADRRKVLTFIGGAILTGGASYYFIPQIMASEPVQTFLENQRKFAEAQAQKNRDDQTKALEAKKKYEIDRDLAGHTSDFSKDDNWAVSQPRKDPNIKYSIVSDIPIKSYAYNQSSSSRRLWLPGGGWFDSGRDANIYMDQYIDSDGKNRPLLNVLVRSDTLNGTTVQAFDGWVLMNKPNPDYETSVVQVKNIKTGETLYCSIATDQYLPDHFNLSYLKQTKSQ